MANVWNICCSFYSSFFPGYLRDGPTLLPFCTQEQGVLHAQINRPNGLTFIHSIEDARAYLLRRDVAVKLSDKERDYANYFIQIHRKHFLEDFTGIPPFYGRASPTSTSRDSSKRENASSALHFHR